MGRSAQDRRGRARDAGPHTPAGSTRSGSTRLHPAAAPHRRSPDALRVQGDHLHQPPSAAAGRRVRGRTGSGTARRRTGAAARETATEVVSSWTSRQPRVPFVWTPLTPPRAPHPWQALAGGGAGMSASAALGLGAGGGGGGGAASVLSFQVCVCVCMGVCVCMHVYGRVLVDTTDWSKRSTLHKTPATTLLRHAAGPCGC